MTPPKRPEITLEESQLFQKAVHDVIPLKNEKRTLHNRPSPKKNPAKPRLSLEDKIDNHIDIARDTFYFERSLSTADTLSFSRNGVSWKQIQQLKRGRFCEASLDLHQKTVPQAQIAIERFIQQCLHTRKRWIRLIHGKGSFSADNKPVLKNFLNQYLRKHPAVLAFHSAPPKKGGTGALYLLLKMLRP